MDLQSTLKKIMQEAIKSAFDLTVDAVLFELPKDPTHGDLATPVAFSLAKPLSKAPKQIAEAIVSMIPFNDIIDAVSVAGPGFINFTFKKSTQTDVITHILEDFKAFSETKVGLNQNVLLEFVSVNPTGLMHIGHARGAASGDTLARLLRKNGYDVLTEYYVNDAGNQMDKLAESLYARYLEAAGKPFNFPEDGYHGEDITAFGKALFHTHGLTYIDHPDGLKVFKKEGLEHLLSEIKKDLASARVHFDSYYHESSLYASGAVEDVLIRLKASGQTYTEEGALYLKTSAYGDEKDRVLVKSNGDYTYILPDIAYHEQKIKRGYTTLIDILGTDHHGYVARLKASLKILGYEDLLEVLLLQMVRVIEDGVEIKMSKRSGQALALKDLIEDVGPDPIRYFFAARSLHSHMDLDIELARKQKNDNPVFYVQYAYARIQALFEKATHLNHAFDPSLKTFNTLENPLINDLLNHLRHYPDTLKKAALSKEIHKVPKYLHDLAGLFHKWYSAESFLTGDPRYIRERLSVLKALEKVFEDGFELIGIEAKRVM
jgi:arginyl-tRNA synthetase